MDKQNKAMLTWNPLTENEKSAISNLILHGGNIVRSEAWSDSWKDGLKSLVDRELVVYIKDDDVYIITKMAALMYYMESLLGRQAQGKLRRYEGVQLTQLKA